MSSPDTNPATESGASTGLHGVALLQPEHSGATPAPVAIPIVPDRKVEPRSGDIAFRMISNFAAENLRHAADALEAGMPNLARHHANKAIEQIDHIDRL